MSPNIPTINWSVNFSVSPIIMWLPFLFLCLVWAVASWIFTYHWKTFGANLAHPMMPRVIYFGVSGALIITTAFFIWTYGLTF